MTLGVSVCDADLLRLPAVQLTDGEVAEMVKVLVGEHDDDVETEGVTVVCVSVGVAIDSVLDEADKLQVPVVLAVVVWRGVVV